MKAFQVSSIAKLVLLTAVCMVSMMSHASGDNAQRVRAVPLPLGTQIEWIASEAIHNDAPVSIASYDSPLSLTDTVEFYKQAWPEDADSTQPGMIESRVGNWLLISRLRDGVNTVIQLGVQEPSRSRGYLSVMSVNHSTIATGVKPIDGMQTLSKTHSVDGARTSTLSVHQSMRSVEDLKSALVRARENDDWILTSTQPYKESQIVLMSRRLFRTSGRLEMVITRNVTGQTVAVVNEVFHED